MASRLMVAVTRPMLAAVYRARRGSCPSWMLRALGFRLSPTLSRLLGSLPSTHGVVIECGIYRGASLLGMAHHLRRRGLDHIPLIGCDSFEGLPQPSEADALPDGAFAEKALRGTFRNTSPASLQRRIDALGFPIRLVQGFFEQTLPQLSAERFVLAHLDCDLYESYWTCLRHIYPRVIPGGFIVFDEYRKAASIYPGASKAIDEFLADKPESLQCFADLPRPRYFIQKL